MATLLPASPYPKEALEWGEVGRGGLLHPLVGGKVQFQARLGDMLSVTARLPSMRLACADEWLAAMIIQRRGVPVRWPLPPPYRLAGAGAPLVKGANQQGSTLLTDGWTAGFTIPIMTAFNVPDADGRPSLHFTTAATTADGSGNATLSFGPMLRIVPADNAALQVANPVIQGWMNDCGIRWTVRRLQFHDVPFQIVEDA